MSRSENVHCVSPPTQTCLASSVLLAPQRCTRRLLARSTTTASERTGLGRGCVARGTDLHTAELPVVDLLITMELSAASLQWASLVDDEAGR